MVDQVLILLGKVDGKIGEVGAEGEEEGDGTSGSTQDAESKCAIGEDAPKYTIDEEDAIDDEYIDEHSPGHAPLPSPDGIEKERLLG